MYKTKEEKCEHGSYRVFKRKGKLNMAPLNEWLCDSCGEIIPGPDRGYLEWYKKINSEEEAGFIIVHQPSQSCQYDDKKLYREGKIERSLPLTSVVGPNGLVDLMFMFQDKRLEDKEELTEIIRRLHIPYYEQARQYWRNAKEDEMFVGMHPTRMFHQDIILEIIDKYERGEPKYF
jgi:hypothetical protein